jgi:hypothetical protein
MNKIEYLGGTRRDSKCNSPINTPRSSFSIGSRGIQNAAPQRNVMQIQAILGYNLTFFLLRFSPGDWDMVRFRKLRVLILVQPISQPCPVLKASIDTAVFSQWLTSRWLHNYRAVLHNIQQDIYRGGCFALYNRN